MPSKRSLNQFVADKSRAGDFDSAGEFTVSTDRALEKLRVHSLENPSDWVLKMVQAAVAGHASEVRFTQFRNRVKVEFALPEPLERERLAQAWLSPKLGQQGEFLSELLIGLRPFLLSQRLLFRLGKDELLEWVGEELRVEGALASPHEFCRGGRTKTGESVLATVSPGRCRRGGGRCPPGTGPFFTHSCVSGWEKSQALG